jgi:hypothetical protein
MAQVVPPQYRNDSLTFRSRTEASGSDKDKNNLTAYAASEGS